MCVCVYVCVCVCVCVSMCQVKFPHPISRWLWSIRLIPLQSPAVVGVRECLRLFGSLLQCRCLSLSCFYLFVCLWCCDSSTRAAAPRPPVEFVASLVRCVGVCFYVDSFGLFSNHARCVGCLCCRTLGCDVCWCDETPLRVSDVVVLFWLS